MAQDTATYNLLTVRIDGRDLSKIKVKAVYKSRGLYYTSTTSSSYYYGRQRGKRSESPPPDKIKSIIDAYRAITRDCAPNIITTAGQKEHRPCGCRVNGGDDGSLDIGKGGKRNLEWLTYFPCLFTATTTPT